MAIFFDSFSEDLATLEKIPLIPALLCSDMEGADLDVTNTDENTTAVQLTVNKKIPKSLLEWISATDKSCMEVLYKNCRKGLEEVKMI